MAYKDEYEVARLYTDGEFQRRIAEEFEGEGLKLEFYMAPPVLVKPKGGRAAAPKKVRFGPVAPARAEGAGARQGPCAARRSIRSAAPRSESSSGA